MAADRSSPSPRVLLIISGGIAAYKSLELIRLLRAAGTEVRCVLTEAARQFITPLSVQALSGSPVGQELFSLTDEQEMGHIALARQADLIVVAPATANLLAKMACGLADDLASTLLLAADGPVLLAPAMNVSMWEHPATQASVKLLQERGVRIAGPEEGSMACGEYGPGRLIEPETLSAIIQATLHKNAHPPLAGRRILVTAGPTHEPVDPVRYLANRSSGRQGYAIASALAELGADVTLISGPTNLPDPPGLHVVRVVTAVEMDKAVKSALPVDAAVCTAAVADWRVDNAAASKIKKTPGGAPPALHLIPNPDILASLSAPGPSRPALVVGFAAETDDVEQNAATKRQRKGCDWIVANDVSPGTGVMGGVNNQAILFTEDGTEHWPLMSKTDLAHRLAGRIAQRLETCGTTGNTP